MKKLQGKLLLCALSFCACAVASMVFAPAVQAEDYEGKPITVMDEEGNIYEVEPEVGLVEEEVSAYANGNEMLVNMNTKGNAVTEYVEEGTGDAGYTNGAYGADAAYLGESGGKVRFMLSGVIGLVKKDQVQIVNKSSARSVSYYTAKDGWLTHYVTTNINGTGYASAIRNGLAPDYLAAGTKYYSYDGHYFYTEDKYAAMLEDYKNNNRNNSVNKDRPFYNYFQYLPFRSATSYSGDTMNSILQGRTIDGSKMRGIGPALVNQQNTYGVNGLLSAGVAANESAWGSSSLALRTNNIFSINAVDSNPNGAYWYSSPEACIEAFMNNYMSQDYLNPTDWKYFGGFLGNKASGVNVKYASDPFWGEKAAAVAWQIDDAGGRKDQYAFTLGIKDTFSGSHQDLTARADANSSSTALYSTGTQSNTSFLLMDNNAQNGFYKVMSDPVLNSGRTGIEQNVGKYDFSKMYAYLPADKIAVVNTGSNMTDADRFWDVNPGDWFYDSVNVVFTRGIMTGMNTFSFGPAEDLSRGQFATIIYRMAGSPSVSYSTVFPDVPDGYFFTSPVMWAHEKNIIMGYENGLFGAGDLLTREQMAVLMYRYAQFAGLNTADKKDLSGFPDASSVSDFAKEGMSWAVGVGLIQGDQGKINPQGNASRAQCATIITRFLQKYGL